MYFIYLNKISLNQHYVWWAGFDHDTNSFYAYFECVIFSSSALCIITTPVESCPSIEKTSSKLTAMQMTIGAGEMRMMIFLPGKLSRLYSNSMDNPIKPLVKIMVSEPVNW